LICSSASAQNLFVSGNDADGGKVFEFTTDGVESTFASGLSGPQGLAFDSAGNLFVADSGDGSLGSGSIIKFTQDGAPTTLALGLNGPLALAFDGAGILFVVENGTGSVLKFTADGVRSTFASGLEGPWGLAIDRAGNVFVTDSVDVVGPGHAHIYKFTPDGARTIVASGLLAPLALAFDSAGNLFVMETGDLDGLGAAIYKFTPDGRRSTFAAPFQCMGPGLAINSADNVFVPDWCTGDIHKFTPSGLESTFVSGANHVTGSFLAFQPMQSATPNVLPFFNSQVSLGNNRYWLQFPSSGQCFGYYNMASFPWLYHQDMGWEYFIDANNGGGAYLYDWASQHWWYTGPTTPFPYLYDFSLQAWLYYSPVGSCRYSSNPRWFYNFGTGQWITL
jgi:sugar lactone lactonase YvrE